MKVTIIVSCYRGIRLRQAAGLGRWAYGECGGHGEKVAEIEAGRKHPSKADYDRREYRLGEIRPTLSS